MSGADLAFFIVVPLAILALLPIVWIGAAVWRPTMFVVNGHWEAARWAADRVEQSFLRSLPGALAAARYARCLAYHLEGDFERSLATIPEKGELLESETVDVGVLEARRLEAGNLVMLNRDAKRATKLLEAICAKADAAPEDIVMYAVAQHMRGKRTRAQETFERAGIVRPKNAPWPRLNEPVFHYLRALYLVRTGNAPLAQRDLELASSSPIPSIYVLRARALLPPTSSARELEYRSSLDAQVMDEDDDDD